MRSTLTPLYSRDVIQARVKELAKQIDQDFGGRPIVAIGVLQGCFIFFSDLTRELASEVRCEFLGVSAYAGQARSGSGEEVKITLDLEEALEGKDLLLVEDLVDTGATLAFLQRTLRARNPRTLKTCAFLVRRANLNKNVALDYVGFDISDPYVVGYGVDHEGEYRTLPYIAAVSGEKL